MITFARPCSSDTTKHDKFLEMLPAIREQARLAFRSFDPEAKEELIAEVVANAFCAYERLVQRGKEDVAHATPLAWYAIKQVRSGRRVGSKLSGRDVMSPANHRITVEQLDQFDQKNGEWKEALVEDKHAGPADTAAARIDVADWFRSLGRTKRRIAKLLARGEGTGAVAKKSGLSPGRISQLRAELQESWMAMQGEVAVAPTNDGLPSRPTVLRSWHPRQTNPPRRPIGYEAGRPRVARSPSTRSRGTPVRG
jgi:hypothetical protein